MKKSIIDQVAGGRPVDDAVDASLESTGYADNGFADQLAEWLGRFPVAVVRQERRIRKGVSELRLDLLARGSHYGVSIDHVDGKWSNGRIACRTTGYRRGLLAETALMVILQSLLGGGCMGGDRAVERISMMDPDQPVPCSILGIPWTRFDGAIPAVERVPGQVSTEGVSLSTDTLLAGPLFEALLCDKPDRPVVKQIGDRPLRWVVLEQPYVAAAAHLLGRKKLDVLEAR